MFSDFGYAGVVKSLKLFFFQCKFFFSELQKNLVASLELGLTSLGVDNVYSLCCDFVQVLCSYMLRYGERDVPMYEALRPFLKVRFPVLYPILLGCGSSIKNDSFF